MGRRCFLEALDSRIALAGDVSAGVRDGWLRLDGDASGNDVLIQRLEAGGSQVRVVPLGTTTLNGRHAASVFDGFRSGLRIDAGDGDDVIRLDGVRVRGSVRIDAGSGDDRVLFRTARVTGHTAIDLGDGRDDVTFRAATLQHDLVLDGGAGDDTVTFSLAHLRRGVRVEDDQGATHLRIGRSTFDRTAAFATGASADRVAIDGSTFKQAATLTTSDGDDHTRIRGTIFRQPAAIDDGAGDDVLDRELILSWNFADGAQGWGGGFSDFSPSVVNPGDDGYAKFELSQKIASLPVELGLKQTGYRISGRNLSDDLFMFLTKPVVASDGIIGGVDYDVTFDVRFASNVPAGLIGGGGAPAEAVFFKVGGVTQRPETYFDEEADIVINLNKQGGDMSGAGDIRNGKVVGDDELQIDPEKVKYKLVKREKTHSNPVRAHRSGRLWLILGTDSGFESTTTLYYSSISVRMTPRT